MNVPIGIATAVLAGRLIEGDRASGSVTARTSPVLSWSTAR